LEIFLIWQHFLHEWWCITRCWSFWV